MRLLLINNNIQDSVNQSVQAIFFPQNFLLKYLQPSFMISLSYTSKKQYINPIGSRQVPAPLGTDPVTNSYHIYLHSSIVAKTGQSALTNYLHPSSPTYLLPDYEKDLNNILATYRVNYLQTIIQFSKQFQPSKILCEILQEHKIYAFLYEFSIKFEQLQKSSAKLMIKQEEYLQEKKQNAILQKIHASHEKKETPQKYSIQRVRIENFLININNKLNSDKPQKIIDGLNALRFSKINKFAHRFFPRMLTFIQTHNNTQLVLKSIDCLVKSTYYGKLSESIGVDIILKKIKHGTTKQHQCQLFRLVTNLAIDSVAMRDFLIQKGTIEVILQVLQQNLYNTLMDLIKLIDNQDAYFALIALVLGDPLPPRHKVEKAVHKIVADINLIYPYSHRYPFLSCQEVIWVLYHYYDFKEQKQCIQLLKYIFKLYKGLSFKKQTKIQTSFKQIFMQIYDYYSEKPDNKIIPILHRCCYEGTSLFFDYQSAPFSFYTTKMYIQLFKEAVKHKMNKIVNGLVIVLKYAFQVIKNEKEQAQILPTLKFISWVLSPLVKKDYYNNYFRPLTLSQYQFLTNEIFPITDNNLNILVELRHGNRRRLERISSTILSKYHKIKPIRQGYRTRYGLSFE